MNLFPQRRIYFYLSIIRSLQNLHVLDNFYIKKKKKNCLCPASLVSHSEFPFSTPLSSVLLPPLVLSLTSDFSFDSAKQRQQQLDQPEKDVDERCEDDNENERDVDEMILVPGYIRALATQVRIAVASSDVFRPPYRRLQRRGRSITVSFRKPLGVFTVTESRKGLHSLRNTWYRTYRTYFSSFQDREKLLSSVLSVHCSRDKSAMQEEATYEGKYLNFRRNFRKFIFFPNI